MKLLQRLVDKWDRREKKETRKHKETRRQGDKRERRGHLGKGLGPQLG